MSSIKSQTDIDRVAMQICPITDEQELLKKLSDMQVSTSLAKEITKAVNKENRYIDLKKADCSIVKFADSPKSVPFDPEEIANKLSKNYSTKDFYSTDLSKKKAEVKPAVKRTFNQIKLKEGLQDKLEEKKVAAIFEGVPAFQDLKDALDRMSPSEKILFIDRKRSDINLLTVATSNLLEDWKRAAGSDTFLKNKTRSIFKDYTGIMPETFTPAKAVKIAQIKYDLVRSLKILKVMKEVY